MNPTPQLVPHPDLNHIDAELIGAFVENALPARERDHLLAHLATCAHCRQIVYLAQDAAIESTPETLRPQATPTPAKPRSSWLTGWGLAWVPALACAALVLVDVSIGHFHHPQPPEQIAVLRQPPSTTGIGAVTPSMPSAKQATTSDTSVQPQDSVAPPKPTKAKPSITIEPQIIASLRSNQSQIAERRDTRQATASEAAPAQEAPSGSQSAAVGTGVNNSVTGNIGGPVTSGMISNQNVPVQQAPQAASQMVTVNASASTVEVTPVATLDQQQAPIDSTISNQSIEEMPLKGRSLAKLRKEDRKKKEQTATAAAGATVAQTSQPAQTTPAASPAPSPGAATTVEVIATPPPVVDESAVTLSTTDTAIATLTSPSADELAAHKALYTRMPSGLPAISTAALQHHILAVDSAGAVFLSIDLGKTWQPVASQWKGRAVKVLVHRPAHTAAGLAQFGSHGAQSAKADKKDKAESNAPATETAVFEIVTDNVSTWSSPDGKTWERGLP
jgi:Putative zinc-finger